MEPSSTHAAADANYRFLSKGLPIGDVPFDEAVEFGAPGTVAGDPVAMAERVCVADGLIREIELIFNPQPAGA